MWERRTSILKNLDWITVGLYLLLVMLGWFNIYSAVYTDANAHTFDFSLRYGRQLIWIFASLLIMIIALIIDSKFYSMFAYIIYAIVIFMLIAVLLFGVTTNGATSWFAIGPIKIQPSEFAKFATALAVAKYLSKYNLKPTKFRTLIEFSLIAFLPALLILLQNDKGSALVFSVFFLVFFREGMPPVYLMIGFLAVALFIMALVMSIHVIVIVLIILALLSFFIVSHRPKLTLFAFVSITLVSLVLFLANYLFKTNIPKVWIIIVALGITTIWWLVKTYKYKLKSPIYILAILYTSIIFSFTVDFAFNKFLKDYQQRRIKVLLGLESDPYGAGYNVNQSMIAIGSGGPFGKGYLQGTQTKFKFVPEQSTDFIFCTVGEEWGFVGTTTILLLFLALLFRLIYLAERQKSRFSRVYGYSVASLLFLHVIVNVGMTIGLAPVIGIPLPFFSYGGSSLWGFTMLLSIFLKLDVNREQLIN